MINLQLLYEKLADTTDFDFEIAEDLEGHPTKLMIFYSVEIYNRQRIFLGYELYMAVFTPIVHPLECYATEARPYNNYRINHRKYEFICTSAPATEPCICGNEDCHCGYVSAHDDINRQERISDEFRIKWKNYTKTYFNKNKKTYL